MITMPIGFPLPLPLRTGRRRDHHDAVIGSDQTLRGFCRPPDSGATENRRAASCDSRDRDPMLCPDANPALLDNTRLPCRSAISKAFTCSCFSATGVILALTKASFGLCDVVVHVRPVAPIGGGQLQSVEGHIERIADALHRRLGIVALELGEARHQHLVLNGDLDARSSITNSSASSESIFVRIFMFSRYQNPRCGAVAQCCFNARSTGKLQRIERRHTMRAARMRSRSRSPPGELRINSA